MRPTTLLLLFAAACGTPSTLDPEPARPGSLLAGATTLAGNDVVAGRSGTWITRRAGAAPGAGDRSRATEAESWSAGRGGDDAGPAAMAVAGPKSAASASPADPAGVVATLRGGAHDDNAAFADFVGFLARQRADLPAASFRDLDVQGRCHLRVVDQDGRPWPGLAVRIVDEHRDRVVWRGTTYGDGRVPFYPAVARLDGAGAGPFLVEVTHGDHTLRQPFAGTADATLQVPERVGTTPMQLDVAFVIDTTGSMGDEIAAIQATLLQVTQQLRGLGREFDLRYGAVLYRDVGDDYLTSLQPFRGDVDGFEQVLREIRADGGGDGPESLNQALAVAVDGLDWRPGAAKVAFLVADAPPHLDYAGDVPYDLSLRAAVARGIKVHTVAASGLDAVGSLVFRQVAQFTRGEFVYVEYGGNLAASAATHGVEAKAGTGNNLGDILFTRIRDEIAHWGREDQVVAGK